MKLTLQTKAYDATRYGKPWIARVDFSTNGLGDFQYGEWRGQLGEPGELYLDVEEGDVVAQEQYGRSQRTNPILFGVVSGEGLVQWCNSKIEAKVMHLALKRKSNITPQSQTIKEEQHG